MKSWYFSLSCCKSVMLCVLFFGSILLSSCAKDPYPGDDNRTPQVPQLPSGVDLNENTFQITDIQTESLVSASDDNTTLYFDASLSKNQMPSVGQIILQLAPTEKLPYGFLGKVTKVTHSGSMIKSGGVIEVETEAVSLTEAFDKLELNDIIQIGSADFYHESFDDLENSGDIGNIDSTAKTVFKSEDVSVELSNGFYWSDKIEGDSWEVDLSSNISAGGEMRFSLSVEEGATKEDIEVDCDLFVELDYKLSFHAETEDEFSFPIGKPIVLRIPSSIAIQPSIQFYAVSEYAGEFDLCYLTSVVYSYPFKFGRRNGNLYCSDDDLNTVASKNTNHGFNYEESLSMSANGSFYFGLVPEISLKLFGRDDIKLTVSPNVGYEYSGELEMDLSSGGDLYGMLYDEYLNCELLCGIDFGIQLGKFQEETQLDKKCIRESKKYIFPSFSEKKVTMDVFVDEDRVVYDGTVETKVVRDVLLPLNVGLRCESGGDWCCKCVQYYLQDKFEGLQVMFKQENSPPDMYPYIEVGNRMIKAKWFDE